MAKLTGTAQSRGRCRNLWTCQKKNRLTWKILALIWRARFFLGAGRAHPFSRSSQDNAGQYSQVGSFHILTGICYMLWVNSPCLPLGLLDQAHQGGTGKPLWRVARNVQNSADKKQCFQKLVYKRQFLFRGRLICGG